MRTCGLNQDLNVRGLGGGFELRDVNILNERGGNPTSHTGKARMKLGDVNVM